MNFEVCKLVGDAFTSALDAPYEAGFALFSSLESRTDELGIDEDERIVFRRYIKSNLLTIAFMKEQSIATCRGILNEWDCLGYDDLGSKAAGWTIFIRRCIEAAEYDLAEQYLLELRNDIEPDAERYEDVLANLKRVENELRLAAKRA